jgi:hypothetical protein
VYVGHENVYTHAINRNMTADLEVSNVLVGTTFMIILKKEVEKVLFKL